MFSVYSNGENTKASTKINLNLKQKDSFKVMTELAGIIISSPIRYSYIRLMNNFMLPIYICALLYCTKYAWLI